MTPFRSTGGMASDDPLHPQPTILVVDDDDTLRTVLARELRKRRFTVWTAAGGDEAVVEYTRPVGRIDLVLLDVNMPGMSGPDTLDAILVVDPSVRCCFMTADDRPERHAALLARGAADVIAKPFASVNELCATLQKLAGETQSGSDTMARGTTTWKS